MKTTQALVATAALALSPVVHASLIGDIATCTMTSSGHTCSSPSAVVLAPTPEFTLNVLTAIPIFTIDMLGVALAGLAAMGRRASS